MVSNKAILWLRAQVTFIDGFGEIRVLKLFVDTLLYTLHYHIHFFARTRGDGPNSCHDAIYPSVGS
jgi:hypothetical protein